MGRKLVVEVCSGHNLMPKDGQGSCSAFCYVDFDGQRRRTKVKSKDLSPVWNERFEFQISDPANMGMEVLEVSVYCEKSGRGKDSFLGRVKLPGSSFVRLGEEAIVSYPLEKRNIFSHVRGELRMKIWYYDEVPQSKANKEEKKAEAAATGIASEKKPEAVKSTTAQKEEKKQESSSYSPPTVVHPGEYVLRDTAPMLASITGEKVTAYDLVEKMKFLYCRVVKARALAAKDANGSSDPFVKLKIGEGRPAETKVIPKTLNPEWNQTFAFNHDKIQGPVLEITVWDKDTASRDDFLGSVTFELSEVPTRVPPDSPLAPSWYRLEEKKGEIKGETRVKGEIMVAVWWGTQADEAFTEAWHFDSGGQHSHTKSKVYLSPKLWYLRVTVIEAQDLVAPNKNRYPEVSVKVQLGIQAMKTKVSPTRNTSPNWPNDDLLFVAAEPFEEPLSLTVEDRLGPSKDDVLGFVRIPLNTIERRADDRLVPSRWYNLEKNGEKQFRGRIHLRLCFDGGYHVMDESTNHISDMRPTAKQLWKSPLGVLEVGIISGQNFLPMKTKDARGTTDAYCVAKYGPKWIRTRTIVDNFNPKWNEQYTWEVYDPCTVLTVGVFDNCHLLNNLAEKAAGSKDVRIGKVRIRLSTLESDRVYTHSYPLLMLQPSGVKKMGEIELAVRFSCTSFLHVMQLYFKPPLPKMHYRHPLRVTHLENLRLAAITIVCSRLARSEPPLRNEVVRYMLDIDSNLFSMRRSKVNYYRIMGVFSGVLAIVKWFDDICKWTNPVTTVLVHILFLILVWYPELILPTLFLYMFLIGAWHYRFRARAPSSMDAKLSQAVEVDPDELDEEFDTIPTSKSPDMVRARYERLRIVASRIQTVLGDLAAQGERFHALLSWRDPRATAIFITFCLIAAIVLYVTPFQVVAVLVGIYVLRHPRFRNHMPPVPLNFFRRLPSLADRIL
ncbi:hypothetical protein O6H91_19G012500 [Diphasiastrum complanatum]|uniref:Uncharacterized protein n=3 Tax=Diphasiastrum complanatum TaxID=34168 RepID=A0ACC2ASP7_DIPCM|nr:hypothetical protein O6H91_19G011100 [Diphasiastrum complanatum]KAJ7520599.1 hypothetical protein O6H91_19G012500 [Diphasiastrum complanatum]KAJ7520600.1 hypothetical protein O6H91_19G012500 [Diphasiastrum complanatum]